MASTKIHAGAMRYTANRAAKSSWLTSAPRSRTHARAGDLLELIGYIPPAEAEANYYRQLASQATTAVT